MNFKEIELKNFRNYEYCRETFHPKINIFLGENGQGKTSLAEALYIMSLGRSFRTHKDKDMIKFDQDIAVVKSVVEKDGRNIRTDIILSRTEKKRVKINGVQKKKSDLSNNVLIVVFSPEDMKIIKEDPDKRRRFLNREMSQLKPKYYEAFARYTRILNQRNALIKSGNVNRSYIDIWDSELIKYGAYLMRERNEFIKKLGKISSGIYSEITDGKENLTVKYSPDIKIDFEKQSDEIEEIMRENLSRNFGKDIERGITSCGPHRDDIILTVNGVDVRKYGSQGQQRTAALALKLAEKVLIEEETGEKPILILDDVLSELDSSRQSYLIKSLDDAQVFLTSADISTDVTDRFSEKTVFEIKEGKIANKA